MVELAKEAQNINRADAASANDKQMQLSDSESESGYGGISRKGSRKHGRPDYSKTKSRIDKSSKGGSGSGDKDKVVRKKKGQKRPPPSCLNPRCDENHLIKDCSKTSHAYWKKLLKKHFEGRKKHKRDNGGIGSCGSTFKSSAMFRASFCDGGVEVVVKADQGLDANVIPRNILRDITKALRSLQIKKLLGQVQYGTTVKNGPKVTFHSQALVSVLLHIRHGTTLALRNVQWLIFNEDADYVIIGEPVLRVLGLDNRRLLEAAADRHGSPIEVSELKGKTLDEDKSQNCGAGTVQSLMETVRAQMGSTYHCDGAAEEENLEEGDMYVDLGEDPAAELQAEFSKRVDEARSNGISEQGGKRLSEFLNKYQAVFE